MTNTGGGEVDAAGARNYGSVGSSFNIPDLAITQTTQQFAQLTAALGNMQQMMTKLQSSVPGFTTAMSNVTKSISTLSSAAGGSSSVGSGGSSSSLTSTLFGPSNSGLVHDLMLFPARFIQSQVANNRNVVNTAGSALGMQSFGSNTNLQTMMGAMSKQLGGVMGGNPNDIIALMQIASKVGAGMDWRTYQGTPGMASGTAATSPRAAGFLESVRQGQLMNPGADVGTIAGSVGGYLANTGAQQQGAFLTGGAFSMVGSGNRAKSISEWAEGILKWFMNQRPGSKRGKPFDYGELMSQNFPGSNMDAWFTANQVPQDMRDYFWSYALGKASTTGTTGGAAILGQGAAVPTTTQQNPIYQRLAAGNAATRQSFNLGGKLTGMYGNMEQANRWFNEMMGQMTGTVLPGALSSGALSWMQYLPDDMRDMLMSLAERTKVGAAGAGVLGWGSMFGGEFDAINSALGASPGSGDVGDSYGPNGTSGTAGMHPDMRKRINAMMRANPNLSITSGHRDLAKQQTLRRKGGNRVSGKPSAHTRGMAADLGPVSQYGWISRNASKFGLSSGIGQGEPWHVGLGDTISDAAGALTGSSSGLLDMIQGLFGQLSGAIGAVSDPDNQMKGIAGGTAAIMKVLLGMFAQPNADLSNLNFKDVYGTMTGFTKDFFASGSLGLPTGAASGGSGGRASILDPNAAFGGSNNPDSLARAIVAAKAASAAGFHGEELFKILSIAGRESGWVANRVNPNSSDRGLFQINMGANLATLRKQGIASSEADLFDPYINAKAAWYLFDKGGHSWSPWKGSDSSSYLGGKPGWDPNGDEMWRTQSMQPIAREAISQAGVGDVDGGGGAYIMGGNRTSLAFYNSFQIAAGTGGGGGGIDVKATANKLADQLEQQMKQRMSRYN